MASIRADVSTIKELPQSTVRLIGSSQVITSVVSVVKELVENSLDAGATSIDVKLDNYGFDKIEVRDNGCGIPRSDTPYMAQPHYTSKLTTADDLQSLDTYGFRGEALGSLCCVANVSITTMTQTDAHSTTYTINPHGQIMASKPSHLGQGTTVTAANLFKNLPVRRQFYSCTKKRRDELRGVECFLTACGVVFPAARFSLRHDKAAVWAKPPMADTRTVLCSILGATVMGHMRRVQGDSKEPQARIEAFLPSPTAPCQLVTRATSDRCFIYVNRRVVTVKEVEKVLRQRCPAVSHSDGSRYPIAYLHITMATSDVDVNLEPNKTKVLIQNIDKVLEFLGSILDELYVDDQKENEVVINETAASDRAANTKMSNCADNGNDTKMTFEDILDSSLLSDSTVNVDRQSMPIKDSSNRNQEITKTTPVPFEDITKMESTSIPSTKSTPSVCINSSLDVMAADLLQDLKDDDDFASPFDISTPDLSRSKSFQPLCSSTQAGSRANSIEESTKTNEKGSTNAGNTTSRTNVEDQGLPPITSMMTPQSAKTTAPMTPARANPPLSGGFLQPDTPSSLVESPQSWAKGTAIRDTDNNVVKPVTVLNSATLKQAPPTSASKPRTPMSVSSNKKRILSGNHNESIQKFLSANSPKATPKVKVCAGRQRMERLVTFSLQRLQEKYTKGICDSQWQTSLSTSSSLIGRLQSHGAWICCVNNQLTLFQPIRAQEEILYQRMLANHKMETERLDTPMEINSDVVSPTLWPILLSLRLSPPVATDPFTYITDPRLVHNGLKLAHRSVDGQSYIQMVAVATCLRAYILASLCEVLRMIKSEPRGTLATTRPSRIKHYLQSEAVRMSRQLPPTTPREEARVLLSHASRKLDVSGHASHCFHDRPYLVTLYDLRDLPQSQASSQDSHTQGNNVQGTSSLDDKIHDSGTLDNVASAS